MPTTAADAYPESRLDRNPPSSITPSVPVVRSATPPRSRIFNVECGASAQRRGTVSTPKILGPAIIQQIQWKHRTAADPPTKSLEIGWSLAPITENDVSLTAPKGWNAICERLRHFYETPIANLVGFAQVNQAGSDNVTIECLMSPVLITAPEFYLTLSIIQTAGVNQLAEWIEVNVLENVSPEVAANFH